MGWGARFVANQAQFTPKTVEIQSERDKLMFRVRVKIAPDLLRAHVDQVRSVPHWLATTMIDRATVPMKMPMAVAKNR